MKIPIIILFTLFSLNIFAQENVEEPIDSIKIKKIELLNANSIDYDEKTLGRNIKRLKGNVQFKHENALMDCDSAYFNSTTNNIKAFSNIKFNQGDSIFLYGDLLFYDGNTKIAKVRNNVRLLQNEATLTTDSLDYDRNTSIAHYFDYGKIIDSANTLTSINGYYYSQEKNFFAIDSVLLINDKYTMTSDTLLYNTTTKITSFFGPTTIVSDTNMIYCENGWYNTNTEVSQYNKNAYLKSTNTILKGDSLYYDRNKGLGKAFNNIHLEDSTEKIIITGNLAYYFENPQYSFVTDSTLFMQYNDIDTMFLHADTLKYILSFDTLDIIKYTYDTLKIDSIITIADTLNPDSIRTDTIEFIQEINIIDTIYITQIDSFKLIRAFHKTKMFKSDIQAKCDSLVYSMKDSTIQLFIEPIIWSDENQITAEYIELHTKNNKPTSIKMDDNAYIISKEDTIRFNQIKGKNMIGYFRNDSLYKVDVKGNGESVYFATEEDEQLNKELIGVNHVESSNMIIYLEGGTPIGIKFYKSPKGTLNPINFLPKSKLALKDFKWLDYMRPNNVSDLFIWEEEKVIEILPTEGKEVE